MSNVFEIGPIAEIKRIVMIHIKKICHRQFLNIETKRAKFLDCLDFFNTHPDIDGLLTDAVNSLNYSITTGDERFFTIIHQFISDELDKFLEPTQPLVA